MLIQKIIFINLKPKHEERLYFSPRKIKSKWATVFLPTLSKIIASYNYHVLKT